MHAPMLYVSLLVEALRARPIAMFWVAALSQAILWVLLPTLIYVAPPGDVPLVLATGHEWLLGSPAGPPLAPWLAEIAFDCAQAVAILFRRAEQVLHLALESIEALVEI